MKRNVCMLELDLICCLIGECPHSNCFYESPAIHSVSSFRRHVWNLSRLCQQVKRDATVAMAMTSARYSAICL